MTRKSRTKRIWDARKKVQADISAWANQEGGLGGKYARGLAGEGYKGGYRDGLEDALLMLNGVTPDRNGWWEEDE